MCRNIKYCFLKKKNEKKSFEVDTLFIDTLNSKNNSKTIAYNLAHEIIFISNPSSLSILRIKDDCCVILLLKNVRFMINGEKIAKKSHDFSFCHSKPPFNPLRTPKNCVI